MKRKARMKKAIVLALTDEQLIELSRILQNRNEKEALRFLERHVKGIDFLSIL